MSPITRAELHRMLQGHAIDVNNPSEAVRKALDEAAVDLGELQEVAGGDGILSGHEDLDRLFHSLSLVDIDSRSFSKGTPAGNILTALQERATDSVPSREHWEIRTVERAHFLAEFDQAPLAVRNLTQRHVDLLAEAGVVLHDLANENGFITGRSRLSVLYSRLEAIDEPDNPSQESFDRTNAVVAGQPAFANDRTLAGEVYAVLQEIAEPFEHTFRAYQDLSRALTVAANPNWNADLDVQHVVQAPGQCAQAAARMVQQYATEQRTSRGQDIPTQWLLSSTEAHYMSKTERLGDGAIAGHRGDFMAALDYIDECLVQHERPVMVGVSHSDYRRKNSDERPINADKVTDHFLVITGRGRDDEGRLFYRFLDPAFGEFRPHHEGRLYVDEDTGALFRPPLDPNSQLRLARVNYQISQVRPYPDIDFATVTGRQPSGATLG